MNNRKFGALSSSENPQELAATVKAVIIALSSIIIMVAGHYGLAITESQIVEAASQFALAISSIYFCFGIIRKFIVKISQKPTF